jgi:hypothetical protein
MLSILSASTPHHEAIQQDLLESQQEKPVRPHSSWCTWRPSNRWKRLLIASGLAGTALLALSTVASIRPIHDFVGEPEAVASVYGHRYAQDPNNMDESVSTNTATLPTTSSHSARIVSNDAVHSPSPSTTTSISTSSLAPHTTGLAAPVQTNNVSSDADHDTAKSLDTLDNTDWNDFAYAQYVTNEHYLCNAVMIFETLSRLGCRAKKLMMFPDTMDRSTSSQAGQLIAQARDDYGVILQPVAVQHRDTADR